MTRIYRDFLYSNQDPAAGMSGGDTSSAYDRELSVRTEHYVAQACGEIAQNRRALLENGPTIGCLRTFNCNSTVLAKSIESSLEWADIVLVTVNSDAETGTFRTPESLIQFFKDSSAIKILTADQLRQASTPDSNHKFIIVNSISDSARPSYSDRVSDNWCRGIYPIQLMVDQARELSRLRQGTSDPSESLPGRVVFFSTEVAIDAERFNAMSSKLREPFAVMAGLRFEHHLFTQRRKDADGAYTCSALRQPRNTSALWLINDLAGSDMQPYIIAMLELEDAVRASLQQGNRSKSDLTEKIYEVFQDRPLPEGSEAHVNRTAYKAAATFVDLFEKRGGFGLKPEAVKLLGMEEVFMAHHAAARMRSELLKKIKRAVRDEGGDLKQFLGALTKDKGILEKHFKPTMQFAEGEPVTYNKDGWDVKRHALHNAKFDVAGSDGQVLTRGFESFMHLAATCFSPTRSRPLTAGVSINEGFVRSDVKVRPPKQ